MANPFMTLYKLRKLILAIIVLLVVFVLIGSTYFYFRNKSKSIAVDFYGTSIDNNSRQVENVLLAVKERLGNRVTINVHLVSERREDGSFLSFNEINDRKDLADFDIEENMRQLVIKKYYPDDFFKYLRSRNTNVLNFDWRSHALYVGIENVEDLNKRANEEGADLLNKEIDDFKVWRESVAAPPRTIPNLVINGELYTGAVDTLALGSAIVKPLIRQGRDSLPQSPYKSLFSGAILVSSPFAHKVAGVTECYNDFHCDDKAGKEGFCVDRGTRKTRCVYIDPAQVDLTVLAPQGYDRDDDVLLWSIKQNIKGVKPEIVYANTPEGKTLQEQANITNVPAYVFARNLENTKYFNLLRLQNNFTDTGDFYLLNVQPPAQQLLNEPEKVQQAPEERSAEELEATEPETPESEVPESEEGGGGEE